MASFTVGPAAFAVGTTVGAYPRTAFVGDAGPFAEPVVEAVVDANLEVAFGGLAYETQYWAAAPPVTGLVWRKVAFTTDPDPGLTPATLADLAALPGAADVTALEAANAALEARADVLESGQPINVAQQAGADNAEKLTAAIAALPATGAWLHIPRGLYIGSWTISDKEHLTVTGEGSSSTIHNATESPADALKFVDCDELTVRELRVQGAPGTRDGLRLENCQRATVGRIFCRGSGRYGIYAQKCFGIVVEPCAVGIDSETPYPTDVAANCLSGLVLGWDGVDITSGCNQFVVNGGFYVVGKSQDTAIVVDHADGGLINSPIPELSSGGIRIVDSVAVQVNGYYGEANPSDIEYVDGTCTVTNGSATVTGVGTAWDTLNGEGFINAYPGKWVIVGTSWARILSVESDTSLTLEEVWPGATAAGTAYRIQSVDLHLKDCNQCAVYSGRGAGAVLVEGTSRCHLFTVTESIFFDADSKYNTGTVIVNRASASANRKVDNGVKNQIFTINYQTNAPVSYGSRHFDEISLVPATFNTDAALEIGGYASGYALAAGAQGNNWPQFLLSTQGIMSWGAGNFGGIDLELGRGTLVGNQLRLGDGDSLTLGEAVNAGGNFLQFFEQTADPAAAPANGARLFAKDNGAGKTQICARFATGAVVVIATEP